MGQTICVSHVRPGLEVRVEQAKEVNHKPLVKEHFSCTKTKFLVTNYSACVGPDGEVVPILQYTVNASGVYWWCNRGGGIEVIESKIDRINIHLVPRRLHRTRLWNQIGKIVV